MRRGRTSVVGWTLAALLTMAVAAAQAGAAVTIGATPSVDGFTCSPGSNAMTVLQRTRPPAGPQYSAPSPGVITSWSIRSGASIPAHTRLQVARVGATDATLVGRSGREIVAANAVNTFPTRVSVSAGDVIGVLYVGGSSVECSAITTGAAAAVTLGTEHQPGELFGFTSQPSMQLSVSAQLEPDADNDGFGDETQDQCTSDANTQGTCADRTPPSASIAKKPKKRSSKRKAKFTFGSDDPSATFSCSLDGKPFATCTSPDKLKVKRGRHTFTVLAKDAAGNISDPPATTSWTVK
jgi:hypothetical protein